LTERMQALDKQLSVDSARMEELRKRIRQSPDYPEIMQQQLEFDKVCNKSTTRP